MTGFLFILRRTEILTFPSPLPSPAVSVMVWYTIYNAPYTRGPKTSRSLTDVVNRSQLAKRFLGSIINFTVVP